MLSSDLFQNPVVSWKIRILLLGSGVFAVLVMASVVWFWLFAVHEFPPSEVRIVSAVEVPDGVKVRFTALETPIFSCPGAEIDEWHDRRNIVFLRVYFERRPVVEYPRIIRRIPGQDYPKSYIIFPKGKDLYFRGQKLEVTKLEPDPSLDGADMPTSGR